MLRAWKKNRWSHRNPHFLTFSWRVQLAGGTVMLVCVSSLWRLLISFLHIVMSGSFFPPSCVINAANTEASSLQASLSPADLHGMWYPTVRRTLVCLSKLYRCIDVSLVVKLFSCWLSFIHSCSYLSYWRSSREQSSKVYLKKPYLPAFSPCLKLQMSSLKTRFGSNSS